MLYHEQIRINLTYQISFVYVYEYVILFVQIRFHFINCNISFLFNFLCNFRKKNHKENILYREKKTKIKDAHFTVFIKLTNKANS